MRYYFNTPNQIAGDEAYNEKKYTEALIHYKHALQTLNQLASQRKFKRSNDFRYAFTYVICEIIQTSCDAIRTTIDDQEIFNYEPIKELWQEVPGLIIELETVFKEMGAVQNKNIIKDKIEFCYKLLADVCDMISEELSDERDDETLNESDILSALEWLTKAIDYSKRANLSIDINLHLGYLNLLEQAYKCSSDKNFILKIKQYINHNKLLELPFTSMQALEILSYQLLVAVEDSDSQSANQLIKKFEKLLLNSDVDQDHYIIEDIQKLIAKLSHEESDSLKKRQLKGVGESSSNDEDESEVIVIKKSSKRPKTVILEDADNDNEISASPVAESIPCPIGEQPSYLKDLPSISQTIHTTFFANKNGPAKKVTFKEKPHSSAFMETFNKISEKASNPEFLANILSLIADFYYETELPLKNTPLLALELYENVLLLSPNHPVAINRINNISNHAIIRDNNRYGSKSILPVKDARAIFSDAIETTITQIEAFLFEDIEKINKILDKNVLYVANKLVSKNVAGYQSAEIAKQIKTLYEYLSTHERTTEHRQASMLT
ncbi:hypothetical protein ACQUW5_12380 [Legionella sp. CNM-1927-20]|uniref:hypothetical protein n=1 Tax=Legionella sp. CNM-1927-20 TaxID=3422221 RepID=UPI00403AFF77